MDLTQRQIDILNFYRRYFYGLTAQARDAVIPDDRDGSITRENQRALLKFGFIKRHASRAGKRVDGIDAEAMRALVGASWPGNVRELENTVERAVVLARRPVITADDVTMIGAALAPASALPGLNLKQNLEWTERETVRQALAASRGVKKDAAEAMGISQRAMSYYLAKHRLGDEPA